MEYKEGARVYLANGEDIGKLARVVIDPRTMQVTDIVISHGMLRPEERIAAAALIDYVGDDGIHMKELSEGVDSLQPFEETTFRLMDAEDRTSADLADSITTPALYSYPPTVPVSGGMYTPGSMIPSDPPSVSPGQGSNYTKETIRNVPNDTVTLNEGARVVSLDGAELGKVDRIFTRPENGRISHFVISRGLLLKERKLTPFDWVDLVSDNEVRLGVNARFIEHLPDYTE